MSFSHNCPFPFPSADTMMSVDPGLNTGIVHWIGNCVADVKSLRASKKTVDPISRLVSIWDQFEEALASLKPALVLIEDQWFAETSIVSLTSAKRGNLKLLTWITGGMVQLVTQYDFSIRMIRPIDWKGNLPDNVVQSRVELILGRKFPDIHTYCAVGIGLYHQQRWELPTSM